MRSPLKMADKTTYYFLVPGISFCSYGRWGKHHFSTTIWLYIVNRVNGTNLEGQQVALVMAHSSPISHLRTKTVWLAVLLSYQWSEGKREAPAAGEGLGCWTGVAISEAGAVKLSSCGSTGGWSWLSSAPVFDLGCCPVQDTFCFLVFVEHASGGRGSCWLFKGILAFSPDSFE